MPMMLSAVVNESSQGTLLSVNRISIQAMPKKAARNTSNRGRYLFKGVCVMGSSARVSFSLPRIQTIQP